MIFRTPICITRFDRKPYRSAAVMNSLGDLMRKFLWAIRSHYHLSSFVPLLETCDNTPNGTNCTLPILRSTRGSLQTTPGIVLLPVKDGVLELHLRSHDQDCLFQLAKKERFSIHFWFLLRLKLTCNTCHITKYVYEFQQLIKLFRRQS